jgi:WXG100 family type VII secretion target
MSNIQVTPEKLRSLAKTCTTEVQQVAGVRTKVGSAIRNAGWKSPAATRFENDWNTKYVKALQELERALGELGQAASKMAANYDSTEAAYKGMQ